MPRRRTFAPAPQASAHDMSVAFADRKNRTGRRRSASVGTVVPIPLPIWWEHAMAGRPRTRRIMLDGGLPAVGSATTAVLVERFLGYIDHERGLAANTRAAYGRDLRVFVDWLGGRRVTNLRVADLGDYLAGLAKRGLARASIARQAATLRSFYSFLQLEGILTESPADLLTPGRRDDSIPGTLTASQVERLLVSPDPATANGLRDRAMLELLYATGCRASEVSTLRMVDVHASEGFCTCRGKGDKERVVPLGKRAVMAIGRWAEGPRRALASTAPWVLLSSRGNRLSRMRIWEIVRRHAERSGIPPDIGPHTLRHSFATHMVAGGTDLRHVQEMLGHASIATTQRYTHVDPSRLKSVHERFHPRR
jgi:integrase/recombinase XerD